MTKKVVCIMCPLGCEVQAEVEDQKISKIEGYGCEDGREYAEQEIASPKRTVMSVVRCFGGNFPTVSVKTSEPVEKDEIEEVMKALSEIEVQAPVKAGEIILKNVCNLGIDVVATRSVEKVQD
ncbi:MAG: DUF1667 domain-containing protein [Candidatus Natronoplasma sp.]